MRSAIAFVLSFIASTLAYEVLTPNNLTGWTTTGGQTFTWSTVNTDPATFALVLTNQNPNSGIAPDFSQNLLSVVTGSALSAVVFPPPGGFQAAVGYRIDFMAIPNQEGANTGILAQSQQFNITAGSSSISASGTTGTTPSTGSTQTGTAVISGESGTSGISGSTAPTSSPASGAASSYFVQPGLLVLFSLLGLTLT